MNRGISIGIGAVLIALAAFAVGWFAYGALGGGGAAAGPGAAMGRLSETERQELQSMSEEERQAFFEEKGIEMPAGGPGMPGGQGSGSADGSAGRGPGGGVQLLEGTVASISDDKLTITLSAGGSANVYVDTSTVVAAVDGSEPKIVQGATVIVTSKPEAAGVNAAATVIVK